MTATRRRYTARQKAKAVGIATVEGVTEAERQTGIPKTTIDYWLDRPEFVQLRTTAREKVIESFWIGIQVGVHEVVKGLASEAPLNHKADALRTLTEKYALLNGEATERTENRELDYEDHEAAILGEVVRSELERRADQRTTEDAVERAGTAGAEGTPR